MPNRYILLILTIVCVVLMIVTFSTNILSTPLNTISGYALVPLQKGLTAVGTSMIKRAEDLKTLEKVMAENEDLRVQLNELTRENTLLQQDKYELTKLRELYELDAEYEDYNKIGARIIARDSGNWYSTFIIDKGSDDGIAVNCNVIAGSGLVGRVTDVGPNYSKVISIISDNTNTSGMILSTGDNLIVTGSLRLMERGVIEFGQLSDKDDQVGVGDKVVTSNISDKYLHGILIGYIDSVNTDSNNITKSGTIIPVVDFKHLEDVLVITDLKNVPEDMVK